jgi:uncharacterized membrane protein
MRIAKPILLIGTPVGVIGGLNEAWKFSPGLAFLMAGLIAMMGFAVAGVVATIRRERTEEAARRVAAERSSQGES